MGMSADSPVQMRIARIRNHRLPYFSRVIFDEAIPKIEQNRVSWFDKLTTNGSAPFVLSLSKDAPRPSLNFGTGS
jgi:hypothetical protein